MPLLPDLPVVDHHCHLSPHGEGVGAARRFARAGGTHLFLATQQYEPKIPTTVEEYRTQYETTEQLARSIEKELPVRVFVVVAPYPVDLIRQAESMPLGTAVDLQRKALELAGHWVEEGRAVALGEVGRPHFPVSDDLRNASAQVFEHALEVARDAGCPAVVHSEDLDLAGYQGLAAAAQRVGLPPDRIVKHYARELIDPHTSAGPVPSYLARRALVEQSLHSAPPWFWETDFLDDPHRPGAVLDLATIPRRVAAILADNPESAERLQGPFRNSIERVYGISLEALERRGA